MWKSRKKIRKEWDFELKCYGEVSYFIWTEFLFITNHKGSDFSLDSGHEGTTFDHFSEPEWFISSILIWGSISRVENVIEIPSSLNHWRQGYNFLSFFPPHTPVATETYTHLFLLLTQFLIHSEHRFCFQSALVSWFLSVLMVFSASQFLFLFSGNFALPVADSRWYLS